MKKILSILLAFCMMAVFTTGCSAQTQTAGSTEPVTITLQISNPMMTVNGVKQEIDPGRGTVPMIESGRTLLPVRAVVEAMGGAVAWDEETQTTVLAKGDAIILLTMGSHTAFLNETAHTLDTVPVIINDRTMLPIRFIAEGFGYEVNWDGDTSTVTLTGTAPEGAPAVSEPTETEGRTLAVYYSRSGNTQALAETVHQAVGGDLVQVLPVNPYPEDYDACLAQVREEQETDFRPDITVDIETVEQYDTILLGYPIWYGEIPTPMVTFLASYDFSGKTIMPFCTSGSSGISSSIPRIRELCPNSTVTDGFRGTSSTGINEIESWLSENDFSSETAEAVPPTGTAGEAETSVENNIVTVANAPVGSTLIMAFYRDSALSDVKLYKGSGTITADISQGMANADLAKIFLWDTESLRPLTETTTEATMTNKIAIAVNGHTLTATLAENSSAQALLELLRESPITVEMQDYGNFEKVGSLGTTLPRNDEQITTQAGDLILYQGNQLTIYYDTNSWNFTRLGKIDDITQSELKEILGTGNVTVTLSLYSVPQQTNPGNFNFETKSVLLNSGYEMPINGLGTYSLHGDTCINSVKSALASGVRLIDTASAYGNEEEIGQAIRESMEELGIKREEIFVTTKIYPGSEMENPEESIQACLDRLNIGYVDMMLLHHPDPNAVKAYKAMEQFVAEGKIRSIGLSNWYVEELEEFLPQVDTVPALVQNEIHPYYQENDVIPYIQNLGITVQGWYPLGGRGHTAELLGDPVISEIAQAHGVSSAQVILRWNLQKGVVVIPGSSNPDHIQENTELYHFSLTDEQMQRINALDRGEKHDWY